MYLYLCTLLLEVTREPPDEWDSRGQSVRVCVTDNQASSSQEWLVQGAKLATQQEQVRGRGKSHLLPAKETLMPPDPGTIQNTSLPILHEDLGQSLHSDLGWGSSLAFTGL